MSDIPRRRRVDQMSQGELAIRTAALEIENMGADQRLTDALLLLMKAQENVADFVDDPGIVSRSLSRMDPGIEVFVVAIVRGPGTPVVRAGPFPDGNRSQ